MIKVLTTGRGEVAPDEVPRRVLVVKSGPAMAITHQLEHLGLVVDLADRVASASGRLGSARYDCVVLDPRLPDADRLEGLRWLRVHARQVPLVVVSDEPEVAAEAAALGVRCVPGTDPAEVVTAVLAAAGRVAEPGAARAYDSLTGLPSGAQLVAALNGAAPSAWSGAVVLLGVDGFAAINEEFGHEGGAAVLREVAGRLSGAVRPGDLAARVGGDEFAVACHGVTSPAVAGRIAQRVLAAVAKPIMTVTAACPRSVRLGASAGVALAGADGDGPEVLLSVARTRCREAKRSGGRRICTGEGEWVVGGDGPAGRRATSADLDALDALLAGLRDAGEVAAALTRVLGEAFEGAAVMFGGSDPFALRPLAWWHPSPPARDGLDAAVQQTWLAWSSRLVTELVNASGPLRVDTRGTALEPLGHCLAEQGDARREALLAAIRLRGRVVGALAVQPDPDRHVQAGERLVLAAAAVQAAEALERTPSGPAWRDLADARPDAGTGAHPG